jgi:aryl-alcohol dehydrogenase-like predicted oxidoreductase
MNHQSRVPISASIYTSSHSFTTSIKRYINIIPLDMASQLPQRQLGKDGPLVARIGFGAMSIGATFYGAVPNDAERHELLDRALEIGETFWDTADIYGDSEDVIGSWFKKTGKRDSIFLATKFGNVSKTLDDGSLDFSLNSEPEYVKEACEKSLARLGVDVIDLYYCHRVDGKTPIEKTVQAMADLVK